MLREDTYVEYLMVKESGKHSKSKGRKYSDHRRLEMDHGKMRKATAGLLGGYGAVVGATTSAKGGFRARGKRALVGGLIGAALPYVSPDSRDRSINKRVSRSLSKKYKKGSFREVSRSNQENTLKQLYGLRYR